MAAVETLTKADLSQHLRGRLDLDRREADQLVNTFLESLIKALRSGEGIELRGFGSFRFRDCPAHQGRNPRTGECILVPPKRVVYFKMGKDLQSRLVDANTRREGPTAPPRTSVIAPGSR